MSGAAAGSGLGSASSIAMPSISMEVFGDVLVAHTPDELTEETVGGFLYALDAPIDEGRHRVVLHMDRTDAFDSRGLEGLLDLRDRVRSAGGTTKVSGLNPIARDVFRITRLDQAFESFPNVLDAVSSFVAAR